MKGLFRLDNHGGLQGKCIDLGLLLFKGPVVHFKKLGVDTGDGFILLAAVVNDEEDATSLLVVLGQRILDGFVFAAFAGKLQSPEGARFLIVEDTKADLVAGIKQAA